VAIDGERLRGSPTARSTGAHLLPAFCAGLQVVIVGDNWPRKPTRVVTGHATFTQTAICQAIIDGGGDYFFAVKTIPPALKGNIEQIFRAPSPLAEWFAPRPRAHRNDREKPRPDRNPSDRDHGIAGDDVRHFVDRRPAPGDPAAHGLG
jgi:hypothetical protein